MKRLCPTVCLLVVVAFMAPSTARAEGSDHPPLLAETLYSRAYINEQTDQPAWEHVLANLNVPGMALTGATLNGYNGCQYTEALDTLHEIILQLGKQSPYLKQWALNQNRVFSACNGSSRQDTPPVALKGQSWPARALSDYQYQLASWYFYKGKYTDALPLYRHVAALLDAPQRPNAAYMVARTLLYLNRAQRAYDKIGAILADPSLKAVHAIAENYRFVIMSNASFRYGRIITPHLAREHLRWLLTLIEADPETALNVKLALKNSADATAQINTYFPLYDPNSLAVDWWLNPSFTTTSPRMQAVMALAPKVEMIDWMQTKWAYNVFDTDWLWALHQPNNPYWAQNRHIVAHAWARWLQTHHGDWLQIALHRIRPDNPLAPVMVAQASVYLTHHWSTATPEYRKWLFSLWSDMIRIDLGRKEYSQALALITQYADYKNLWPITSYSDYANQAPAGVFNKALRWLVYVGADDEARLFLTAIRRQYPNGFWQWKTLLATNLSDAFEPSVCSFVDSGCPQDGMTGNSHALWRALVNRLSTKALFELANNKQVSLAQRAALARTVLTRAILLHASDAVIDRYAVLAADLNPSIQNLILKSVASHRRSRYISMLLKMPRFRPVPYLSYARADAYPGAEFQATLGPYEIDQNNPNDNNWWCRFDPAKLKRRALAAVLISPTPSKIFPVADSNAYPPADAAAIEAANPEFKPYYDNQRALLAQNPYRALIDPKEDAALAAIPSGPQYLSDAVDNREKNTSFVRRWFMTDKEKNRRAEDLHNAVRSTRFGCRRDGSPARYSRESFELIHHFYPNTTWTKATPYWFSLIR